MSSTARTPMLARTVAAGLILTLMATDPAGAVAPSRARGAGELRDLQPTTTQPTDDAIAQVVATESDGSTTITLKVQGLDHGTAGETFGAHVHVGSCKEGDPSGAGPHYNSTAGTPDLDISDETEAWLDFTVAANGQGRPGPFPKTDSPSPSTCW